MVSNIRTSSSNADHVPPEVTKYDNHSMNQNIKHLFDEMLKGNRPTSKKHKLIIRTLQHYWKRNYDFVAKSCNDTNAVNVKIWYISEALRKTVGKLLGTSLHNEFVQSSQTVSVKDY